FSIAVPEGHTNLYRLLANLAPLPIHAVSYEMKIRFSTRDWSRCCMLYALSRPTIPTILPCTAHRLEKSLSTGQEQTWNEYQCPDYYDCDVVDQELLRKR